jgi:HAMP domain-containing protein
LQFARRPLRVVQKPADAIVISRFLSGFARMSPRSSMNDKLALGLVLPLAAGAAVASFLPWPDWRWVAFAVVGALVALAVWFWLRRALVTPLGTLADALAAGRLIDTRELPPPDGPAEIVDLADAVQDVLRRCRRLEVDVEELAALRSCVARLAEDVAAWSERDEPHAFEAGAGDIDAVPEAARPLVAGLRDTARHLEARGIESRTVAGLVRETIDEARSRGEAVTGGAERQFVEATSLLTVLRELRRWAGELAPALDALRAAAAVRVGDDGAGGARWSHLLDEALEGDARPLAAAERAAQRLATSAEDVLLLGAAARLARIEAAAAALSGVPEAAPFVDSLETFVRDTAALRDRMSELERATREELAGARDELAGLRARLVDAAHELAHVVEHPGLAGAPVVPRGVDPAVAARRALDRVHEMVAEALARGEKLVQQAERTSSEALRAGDGVRVALDELDGYRARLESPPAPRFEPDVDALLDAVERSMEAPAAPPPTGDAGAPPMRVLGPADVLDDEDEVGHRG